MQIVFRTQSFHRSDVANISDYSPRYRSVATSLTAVNCLKRKDFAINPGQEAGSSSSSSWSPAQDQLVVKSEKRGNVMIPAIYLVTERNADAKDDAVLRRCVSNYGRGQSATAPSGIGVILSPVSHDDDRPQLDGFSEEKKLVVRFPDNEEEEEEETVREIVLQQQQPAVSAMPSEDDSSVQQASSGPARYVCPLCERRFEREPSLARHLVLHRGAKQFGCEDCGQKFSHTFNLGRHWKRAHQQQQLQQQADQPQHVRCTSCSAWFPSAMVLKVGYNHRIVFLK